MDSRKVRILGVALAGVVIGLGLSRSVSARDDRLKFPIASVLSSTEARAKLDPKIPLYFGKAHHPAGQDLGPFSTNKKTNHLGKSDQVACERAFLSALIELQARVRTLQASAVVAIESNYKDIPFASETEFECGTGSFVAGVALRAQIIKIPGK
ncbi:MAG: hypothetical protein QOI66_185 [Myxococcales bacterium]|jgi:hypothetical protein|nr:hypothetical protein [Myxococcales bacterium]